MDIGIIGCGSMGSALAEPLSKHHTLHLFSKGKTSADQLAKKLSAHSCSTLQELVKSSDWILLLVKPQNLEEISSVLAPLLTEKHTLVSCLVGITLKTLRSHFQDGNLIRMMPNLPVRYGKGTVGISTEQPTKEETLNTLFSSLGSLHILPESQFNAFGSLAGSGPAFALHIIESMIDAAIRMGFKNDQAQTIVTEMLEGTLEMLKQSDQHPGTLRWQIASPGGTTIEGLAKLEETGVRNGIASAFLAAHNKSKTIGES